LLLEKYHQLMATRTPRTLGTQKPARQPQCCPTHVTRTGANAPPKPIPRTWKLTPTPRWTLPIQRATIFPRFGLVGASPNPIRNRRIANDHANPSHRFIGRRGSNAIATVKTDH